eukprot:15231383-Alexandrium_andersonii.AAC.1
MARRVYFQKGLLGSNSLFSPRRYRTDTPRELFPPGPSPPSRHRPTREGGPRPKRTCREGASILSLPPPGQRKCTRSPPCNRVAPRKRYVEARVAPASAGGAARMAHAAQLG